MVGKAVGSADHGGHRNRRAAPRCRTKSRQTGGVWSRDGLDGRAIRGTGDGSIGDGASGADAAARPARSGMSGAC